MMSNTKHWLISKMPPDIQGDFEHVLQKYSNQPLDSEHIKRGKKVWKALSVNDSVNPAQESAVAK